MSEIESVKSPPQNPLINYDSPRLCRSLLVAFREIRCNPSITVLGSRLLSSINGGTRKSPYRLVTSEKKIYRDDDVPNIEESRTYTRFQLIKENERSKNYLCFQACLSFGFRGRVIDCFLTVHIQRFSHALDIETLTVSWRYSTDLTMRRP